MEEEIEEKLNEIYKVDFKVKFIDFSIYEVFCFINSDIYFTLRFKYNNKITFNANILEISEKIDKKIIKFFKKGVIEKI